MSKNTINIPNAGNLELNGKLNDGELSTLKKMHQKMNETNSEFLVKNFTTDEQKEKLRDIGDEVQSIIHELETALITSPNSRKIKEQIKSCRNVLNGIDNLVGKNFVRAIGDAKDHVLDAVGRKIHQGAEYVGEKLGNLRDGAKYYAKSGKEFFIKEGEDMIGGLVKFGEGTKVVLNNGKEYIVIAYKDYKVAFKDGLGGMWEMTKDAGKIYFKPVIDIAQSVQKGTNKSGSVAQENKDTNSVTVAQNNNNAPVVISSNKPKALEIQNIDEYTICAGDTLSKIIINTFGKEANVNEYLLKITKLNKGIKANKLKIGQKIKLPLKID